MIGLDQVWGMMTRRKSHHGLKFGGMMQYIMKRIIIWNAHVQPVFAFSDLGWPRILSFSECLVLFGAVHMAVDCFTISLNGRQMPAIRTVQGNCQWPLKDSGNSHLSSQSRIHCNWGISKPIWRSANQWVAMSHIPPTVLQPPGCDCVSV